MTLNTVKKHLIDFVLPPRCPITGDKVDIQGSLSPEIWSELVFVEPPMCSCCGIPFAYTQDSFERLMVCGQCLKEKPHFETARAGVVYEDGSRDLILKYKHADKTALIVSFRPWLKRAGEKMLKNADAIIPVPLHPIRLFKRRYNQAALIAHDLKHTYGLPVYTDVLKRTRNTPIQGHKNAKQRRANVKSAFAVSQPKIDEYTLTDKKVVLVDDVFTTGATVNECARVLLKSGVGQVDVLTLSRVARL